MLNSPDTSKVPNYAEIIHEILASVDGPVVIEDLAIQILQKRPSKAKDPYQAVLTKIREANGRQLVYLDPTHVLPLRLAYHGARYRIRLTKENVDQSALSIYDNFQSYLSFRNSDAFSLIDSVGNPIAYQILEPPHTTTFSSDKKVEYHQPVVILKEWFRSQQMYHKDHILVTIEDWEVGVFRLERERYGEQRADLLAERNQYFADAFYALLESAHDEDIDAHIALSTIYAKIPDKGGYPPDHWMVIINNDSRMFTNGWLIRYVDSGFAMIDRMFAEVTGESLIAPVQPSTKEEREQTYCFRAFLKDKPSIWRQIEIQGKQTLADLDDALRTAFGHDTSDHLSGFWKLVVRSGGPKKRYREVDLGRVNPFEYGEGSDTSIAALALQVGDRLKYVYDFGDWVEHTLELLSTGTPEKGIRYPREVARNKPKYSYCVECQKKGVQTIATWLCFTCSNEEQREILLCEDCLSNHEDHHSGELIY
jgi:hypothetical protein